MAHRYLSILTSSILIEEIQRSGPCRTSWLIVRLVLESLIILTLEESLCSWVDVTVKDFFRTCDSLKEKCLRITWHKEEVRHVSRNEDSLTLLELIVLHVSLAILLRRWNLDRSSTLKTDIYDEAFELLSVDVEGISKSDLRYAELRALNEILDHLTLLAHIMAVALMALFVTVALMVLMALALAFT